jgi:hypothetical protein
MVFTITPAEIDTIAKKAEKPVDYHLSSVFWNEANAHDATPEKAVELRLIAQMLGLPFRASDTIRPFGDARSNRGLEFITLEQAAQLESMAPQIETAQIRARLADLAWMRRRGNHAIARLAISAHIDSARELEDPEEWTGCATHLERAARLSRSLGIQDESFVQVSSYLLEIVDKYRGNDPLFLTFRVVKLLLEFEVGNPEDYISSLSTAASRGRDAGKFYLCRDYLELLAKLHALRKDDEARNLVLRELAGTFELEAEQRAVRGENLAATFSFNQAIQAHRRVPDSGALIADVRLRLQRVEKASIAEFKKITVPLDVGKSALLARQVIAGEDLRSAIIRLAHVSQLTSFERMRHDVAELASVAPLSFMAAGMTKDAEGRTVGKKPPLSLSESGQDDAVFAHVVSQMRITRQFNVLGVIIPAFEQLLSEHLVTLEEMEALVGYSPFVPPGRERIFSQGLYAGFFAKTFSWRLTCWCPR